MFVPLLLQKDLQKDPCFYIFYFFKFGLTSCKAEQPLRGMELQEKEVQND